MHADLPVQRPDRSHPGAASPSSGVDPPAVVLLSGGLDSAVVMACARQQGFTPHALTIDYQQRHRVELDCAARVAQQLGAASHRTLPLNLRLLGGSALTSDTPVPKDQPVDTDGAGTSSIPVTYVPARNLVFLSLAAAYAETLGTTDLFIGVNSLDYSGYPDCRPAFIASMAQTLNLATRAGVEAGAHLGGAWRIHAPLIDLTKGQIVALGVRLGVDLSLTHSCYDPSPAGLACGHCDSCLLRARGFEHAGVPDPTRYVGGQ